MQLYRKDTNLKMCTNNVGKLIQQMVMMVTLPARRAQNSLEFEQTSEGRQVDKPIRMSMYSKADHHLHVCVCVSK